MSGPTRRELLHAAGGMVGLAAVTSCSFLSTEPTARQDGETGAGGKESPRLARLVEAGKLPELARRLPRKPLVVRPAEASGRYGGDWNTCLLGPSDTTWLYRTNGYEQLMTWDVEFKRAVPNVAESVDVSADARTYTFRLREGMKWSDGEPFTAADIAFAFDDVLSRKEFGGVPSFLVVDGRPAEVEQVDELTVRFTFAKPYGPFLELLAAPSGGVLTTCPKHYDWAKVFKGDPGAVADLRWYDPELATLCAWKITAPLGEGTRLIAERNPYYWKTDPGGRQLPYLDRVVFQVVANEEVILLKAGNGEFNYHSRHINSLANKPVLAKNRESGGYRFVPILPSAENDMILALNLAHEDPALRTVFQNRDFRIGLSHAINRQELIDAAFQRQGEVWQVAPRPESEFYDEGMAKQYTEYDEALANDYLDRAGYARRDGDGFRLRPDGERIRFGLGVAQPAYVSFWASAAQLVVRYWRAVGVDVRVDSQDRSLFYERKSANKHDAVVFNGLTGLTHAAMLDPRWYFPHSPESNFAIPWAAWFASDGKEGVEPPEAPRRQMELYRQLVQAPSAAAAKQIFRQILRIAKDEFYVIGTVMPTEGYGIAGSRFRNVPANLPGSYIYPDPGPGRPEQFFLADA